MKKALIIFIAIAMSSVSWAATTPSQSEESFCADRDNPEFIKSLFDSSSNLMTFRNHGGIANGGVCWWHSRFQRSAAYLTIFKPAEKRPTENEAQIIIDKIRTGKEVIVISGFRNFSEFTNRYESLIQKELEKWQKSDGVMKFNWVMGLKGANEVSAEKLKESMDELYDYVEREGNIAYQKLHIKGVTAHAWLVVKMKKVNDGYDLQILDSNFANYTSVYQYREGMTSFTHWSYGKFVPYLERKNELSFVKLGILKICNPSEYEIQKKKLNPQSEQQFNN